MEAKVLPRPASNSLRSQEWCWISESPSFASSVLELEACVTVPGVLVISIAVINARTKVASIRKSLFGFMLPDAELIMAGEAW